MEKSEFKNPSIEILLISNQEPLLHRFKKLIHRKEIKISNSSIPENALFKILNRDIAAVILDITSIDQPAAQILSSIQSLEMDLEILLIAKRSQSQEIPLHMLRACCSILSPKLKDPRDFLCINQLLEKLFLKTTLRDLQDSSNSDGLTGLYNHAFIQNTLEKEAESAIENNAKLSLIFFDIDHFKNFNDTNGHPEGDIVLKRFAKLITKSVRKIDYSARYGGEEFIILLPGTGLKTAVMVAERIRNTIAKTSFKHGEKQPLGYVSASFGVSSIEKPYIASKKSLLFHADQALYCAKEKGRDQVWYAYNGKYQRYRSDTKQ